MSHFCYANYDSRESMEILVRSGCTTIGMNEETKKVIENDLNLYPDSNDEVYKYLRNVKIDVNNTLGALIIVGVHWE